MNGHNLPLAMLGALLLWFGWFGFNGGSTLAMDGSVPGILVNTCLAASFGGLTGVGVSWLLCERVNAMDAVNGVIAGLVGITACCHILTPATAAVVGISSSLLCYATVRLLNHFWCDDTIGAVSAHGMAGAWGTLCVALLAAPDAWGNGHDRWDQLAIQATGIGVAFVWAFGLTLPTLWLLNKLYPLRVSRAAEIQGLNIAEHGASTEVLDLLVEMQRQGVTGDFSHPVPVEPHTEVGQIAAGYNRVLEKFNDETKLLKRAKAETEEISKQLVDAAHRAGKAEIATDVLHNVGNVLNSVNVSAGLVMERLESNHSQRIKQTAELIRQHLKQPAEFFAGEGRGAAVPGFLEQVATALEADLAQATRELHQLIDSLDHIKAIVATQQSYAGLSGVSERVDLASLLVEAETLNATSFERHGVQVAREYDQDLPAIIVEKQKLLQILMNLLRNSKEALVEGRTEKRRLTIRVQRVDEENVAIEVRDNGIGIPKANLAKIFNHGFTTKSNGHGFGLHSCANAAKEMSGSLAAHSDGPGSGASFRLTLPVLPQEALAMVRRGVAEDRPYRVAFTDIRMPPGWDGIETTEKVFDTDPEIQVVLCTAYSDYSVGQIVKRFGETDRLLILKKPFDIAEVTLLAATLSEKWRLGREARATIACQGDQIIDLESVLDLMQQSHERLQHDHSSLAVQSQELSRELRQRTAEVFQTREVAALALAQLVESRDPETGEHLMRMQEIAQLVAQRLSEGGPYADIIDEQFLRDFYHSSPLHDIGKVGIPDAILLKPGGLTAAEFEVMKRHTLIGARALDGAVRNSPNDNFLGMAAEIALHHHERWDGGGYPMGLHGAAIPLAARIASVADVFDALTSDRVYKDALPPDEARQIIADGAGSQFDPAVVDAFLDCFNECVALRERINSGADQPVLAN